MLITSILANNFALQGITESNSIKNNEFDKAIEYV
jgi:hypothetical protein